MLLIIFRSDVSRSLNNKAFWFWINCSLLLYLFEAFKVKGFKEDIWRERAESLCYPGLLAKFLSNTYLKEMLLSTGRLQIVEATYDTMWGTGIPLHSMDSLDKKRWKSAGLLGKLLIRIRDNELAHGIR